MFAVDFPLPDFAAPELLGDPLDAEELLDVLDDELADLLAEARGELFADDAPLEVAPLPPEDFFAWADLVEVAAVLVAVPEGRVDEVFETEPELPAVAFVANFEPEPEAEFFERPVDPPVALEPPPDFVVFELPLDAEVLEPVLDVEPFERPPDAEVFEATPEAEPLEPVALEVEAEAEPDFLAAPAEADFVLLADVPLPVCFGADFEAEALLPFAPGPADDELPFAPTALTADCVAPATAPLAAPARTSAATSRALS